MGKTLRPGILTNLDSEKLDDLNELAERTRIPRSVLMREAVDDLLTKHGPNKSKKKRRVKP
jgi:predicted transcriptional regulator